jgi:acyl-CoA synthetase (AMP-forming)/AMP-acid ligase II
MTPLKLVDYLETHVRSNPKSIFLTKIESGETYSYEVLDKTVTNYCQNFSIKGFSKGDRIVYLANNDWFIFPLLIACSMLGLILVPVSPELHLNDIARIIENVNPKVILGTKDNIHRYAINIPKLDIFEINDEPHKSVKLEENKNPDDVLLIVYTSGSSGQCKGVVITESNVIHAANSIVDYYQISHTDRFLCILPLYHMNAIMVTGMVPFLTGASIVLSDVFSFANAMLYFKMVEFYRPSILSFIPSIMSVLIKIKNEKIDFSSRGVRFSFCGAAPLSPELWKEFEQAFNVNVYQGYGLTETTFWATLTPTDSSKDYNSVGIPYNCHVKIEEEGKEKTGEILISGPFVTKGYLNNSEGFNGEGYFKTGDIGYVGENKQLYILGRKKDVIIKNGINIYPKSIDQVFLQHPDIEDCASVGIESDITGEQICTVCVLSQNSTINEIDLKLFAKEHLSLYMMPDVILFVSSLPRGATGKLIKRRLLDQVQEAFVERKKATQKKIF